jgi:hypothetical protein
MAADRRSPHLRATPIADLFMFFFDFVDHTPDNSHPMTLSNLVIWVLELEILHT